VIKINNQPSQEIGVKINSKGGGSEISKGIGDD